MESRDSTKLAEPDGLTVQIIAGSRIHISLADMGFVSPRSYGGIGFMIDRPAARIEVQYAEPAIVQGTSLLDDIAQRELNDLLWSLIKGRGMGVGVTVHEHAPQHVGLGTKTAIKLSIIAGFDELTGARRSRIKQQITSGRGGASGIGIHGFYKGGVLWDAGRQIASIASLLPSSASPPSTPPLLMLRIPFPNRWRVALCLPDADPVHGNEERKFFEQHTPIDAELSLRAMALLYHGILPAFRAVDLDTLASSLKELSAQGFKSLEIARHNGSVVRLLHDFQKRGYAAGMSSMGPLIYVIFDARDEIIEAEIRTACSNFGAKWLGLYRGLNRGATIKRTAKT